MVITAKNSKEEQIAGGEPFLLLDLGTSFLKVGLAKVDCLNQKGFLLAYEEAALPLEFSESKFSFDPVKLGLVVGPLVRQLQAATNIKPEKCFLTASSYYLGGEVFDFSFKRDQTKVKIDLAELENIFLKITHQIKEKIQAGLKGARKKDDKIHLINARFLRLLVDGYLLTTPCQSLGQKLEGKIFIIYTLESCWQKWLEFFQTLPLKEVILVPGFYALTHGLVIPEALLVDIGGQTTEVSLKKQGILAAHLDFNLAGAAFTQALADGLGIGHQEAEEIKIKYTRRGLSPEAQSRFENIFKPVLSAWFKGMLTLFGDIGPNTLLPEKIFLLGGASPLPLLAPGLKRVLSRSNLTFLNKDSLCLEQLTLKDIQGFQDQSANLGLSKPQGIILACLAKLALDWQDNKDSSQTLLKRIIKLV